MWFLVTSQKVVILLQRIVINKEQHDAETVWRGRWFEGFWWATDGLFWYFVPLMVQIIKFMILWE